jgi:hypothetical protein
MAKLSSEYIKKKDYRTAAKWQHREIGIFAGWGFCNEHDLLNNVIQLANLYGEMEQKEYEGFIL